MAVQSEWSKIERRNVCELVRVGRQQARDRGRDGQVLDRGEAEQHDGVRQRLDLAGVAVVRGVGQLQHHRRECLVAGHDAREARDRRVGVVALLDDLREHLRHRQGQVAHVVDELASSATFSINAPLLTGSLIAHPYRQPRRRAYERGLREASARGARAHGRASELSRPASPAGRDARGLRMDCHADLRRHRRRGVPRLAPLRDPARATGTACICLDNLDTGSLTNIEHIRDDAFAFLNHDVDAAHPDRRAVDFVFHFASPGQPDRLPAAAAAHAQGRRLRHAQRARPGEVQARALPARLDQRGLRRPAACTRSPRATGATSTRSARAACTTRPSATPRR